MVVHGAVEMAKSNLAVKEEFEVVTDAVPDYLKDKMGTRGAENVGADDMIIPRIELIQALSPARNKKDSAYIEGAEEGMLYNNVTRQLYGENAAVVPVYYAKQFLVWKDRKAGGGGSNGFRGAFASRELAEMAIAKLGEEGLEVSDTAQHFVLVRLVSGEWQEAVISMAKSKAKVSKRWNSLIRLAGGDSFSRAYKLSAVTETNARNESYFNFSVTPLGFVKEEVYKRAEALYETIRAGGAKVSADYDDTPAAAGETEY
jgi:hypothetical protein